MVKVIIDADSLCVAAAASACKEYDKEKNGIWNDEELPHVYSNVKGKMEWILNTTKASDYEAFLSASKDSESFRLKIYPEYKANRKEQKRPIYEHKAKEYLEKHWKAITVSNIEADDAVAMVMKKEYKGNYRTEEFELTQDATVIVEQFPAIVCHIDKDIDQVPGVHLNYTSGLFYYITPLQGVKNLYLQMLTGDRADNIPRIKKGWRQKDSEEKIKKAVSERELYEIVFDELITLNEYNNLKFNIQNDAVTKRIEWLGNLLYLKKHYEDEYKIPLEEVKR